MVNRKVRFETSRGSETVRGDLHARKCMLNQILETY